MIPFLLRIGPWILGIAKNIRWLGPLIQSLATRSRHMFFLLLWVLAWGGKSAMAVGAIIGFLTSMVAGLSAYGVALSVARGHIPADFRCILDYMHVFLHLRNIVVAAITLMSIRVSIIAYKFGSAGYRNFVMGLLDKLKTAKG